MKNVLISLCVLSCLCMGFNAGTKTFSGGATYSSNTVGDADAVATITVNPTVGYFVMDNLSGNFGLNMIKVGEDDATTSYGFGATYYMGSIYAGGTYNGSTAEGAEGSLNLRAGYLMGCGDAGVVFLDLFGSYGMGLGDAEWNTLTFGVGVATFF